MILAPGNRASRVEIRGRSCANVRAGVQPRPSAVETYSKPPPAWLLCAAGTRDPQPLGPLAAGQSTGGGLAHPPGIQAHLRSTCRIAPATCRLPPAKIFSPHKPNNLIRINLLYLLNQSAGLLSAFRPFDDVGGLCPPASRSSPLPSSVRRARPLLRDRVPGFWQQPNRCDAVRVRRAIDWGWQTLSDVGTLVRRIRTGLLRCRGHQSSSSTMNSRPASPTSLTT